MKTKGTALVPDLVFGACHACTGSVAGDPRHHDRVRKRHRSGRSGIYCEPPARGQSTGLEYGIAGNPLELLEQVAPSSRVHLFFRTPPTRGQLGVVEPATASLEVILTRAKHATRGGTQCAIAAIAGNPNGLVVIASGLSVHCDPFIALAFRYRLSAVYPIPYNVSAGGLICRLPPRPNWLSVLRFTVCVTCKSAQESGLAL